MKTIYHSVVDALVALYSKRMPEMVPFIRRAVRRNGTMDRSLDSFLAALLVVTPKHYASEYVEISNQVEGMRK